MPTIHPPEAYMLRRQAQSRLSRRHPPPRIHLSSPQAMDATALRVATRYLSAASAGDLKKYLQLSREAEKDYKLLPRLFKTWDRQAYGYRTADSVKAKATQEKILGKLRAINSAYSSAFQLAEAFSRTYTPTNVYKTRIFSQDFKAWFKKYQEALHQLSEDVKEVGDVRDSHGLTLSSLSDGLDGGYVAPGTNPLIDARDAVGGVAMYWDTLIRPDLDPVSIPQGGSDTERFLAFLTPYVRRLAQQTAAKIKKNKDVARPLVWLVLEDVNASSESTIAEGLLPTSGTDGAEAARKFVEPVSKALDNGVVEAGVFGVALLEEVGDGALAKRLTTAMAKAFSKFTTAA